MTPAEIRAAIAADPSLTALLPDSQAIADAMSAGRTRSAPVRRADFAVWCGATGLRAAVEDHAGNVDSPLRSAALTIRDFLGGAAESIDFGLAGNQQMLAAWQMAGAITQEQADALMALGHEPDPVAEMDVRRAIWLDDGTRAI